MHATRNRMNLPMMESNSADNECSSTSPDDATMTTTTTVKSPERETGGPNDFNRSAVDVTSTSEEIDDDEHELAIDMSMIPNDSNANNTNGPPPPSPSPTRNVEMNVDDTNDGGIESPEMEESEGLTIDEKFVAEDSGSNNVEAESSTPMDVGEQDDDDEEEENKVVQSHSPPQSPPNEGSVDNNDVSQSTFKVVRSPPSSPPMTSEIAEPSPVREQDIDNDDDDDQGNLLIVENVDNSSEAAGLLDGPESPEIHDTGVRSPSPLINDDSQSRGVIEEQKVIEEIKSPQREESPERQDKVVAPATVSVEDSNSNAAITPMSPPQAGEETSNISNIGDNVDGDVNSAKSPEVEMISNDPTEDDSMDVTVERTIVQVDISSPVQDDSSPDSPEDIGSSEMKQEDSISYDDCSSKDPRSPDGLNGTPVSFLDESQSQTSPPEPESESPKKKEKKVPKPKPTEDIDEEDLEDGEIMDEEEEKDEEESVKAVTPPPAKPKSSSKDKGKEKKSSHKESKSSSSEKRKREDSKDEQDPVKRLLAEVREKDMKEKTEKEKEREKRRREKKRSRDDKKDDEKDKSAKKKKRKVSEEEEDGEEFLLVRGASPGAEGENWEDFGRGKQRRRESEGSASPQQRHHR
jgi:hypothetical protein